MLCSTNIEISWNIRKQIYFFILSFYFLHMFHPNQQVRLNFEWRYDVVWRRSNIFPSHISRSGAGVLCGEWTRMIQDQSCLSASQRLSATDSFTWDSMTHVYCPLHVPVLGACKTWVMILILLHHIDKDSSRVFPVIHDDIFTWWNVATPHDKFHNVSQSTATVYM